MGYSPSVIHRVHPLDAEAYHRIFDPIIRCVHMMQRLITHSNEWVIRCE
jgi:hypothetical protein